MSEDAQRLRSFARKMRSTPTEAEERLWGALRIVLQGFKPEPARSI